MTEAALIEVLIAEIEEGNTAFVTQLLAASRKAILDGAGSIAPLASGGLNGKTFNRSIKLDPALTARACRQALASADGGDVQATTFDFSQLGN